MTQKIYQVDAFATKLFEGNPAAVCVMNEWLPDATMQSIAQENNLAETAFLVANQSGYTLRWFTPTDEVDLCGHATLASAHILYEQYDYKEDQIIFDTRSGKLTVNKHSQGRYEMDFPSDPPSRLVDWSHVSAALDVELVDCLQGKDDILAIVANQEQVKAFVADYHKIKSLNSRGILISAQGTDKDFVSRCFFPNVGVDEDPVTGSAHTVLTPYWSDQLNLKTLNARQLSTRGGDLTCSYLGNRVTIIGNALTYLEGMIRIG